MDILLPFLGQRASLDHWEVRPIATGTLAGPRPQDPRDAHVRVVGRARPGLPVEGGLHRRMQGHVMAYDVFPDHVITGVIRRAPVQVGDTVGAVYHLMPGVDVAFASRVIATVDGEVDGYWKTGFTYQTLEGHPELGEETFSVETSLETGEVRVALRAWSRPGTLLARLIAPLARRWQLAGGRAALDHLESRALNPVAADPAP